MQVRGTLEQLRRVLTPFVLLTLGIGGASAQSAADDTATDAAKRPAHVQVLAFRNGEILNQGSGVVVAEGAVLTSLHLSDRAEQLVVRSASGVEVVGTLIDSIAGSDLALLRATGVDAAPAQLALSTPSEGAGDITGFWRDSEPDRRSTFGRVPRFVAARVEDVSAKNILFQNGVILGNTGRGAYGAPVYDGCRDVLAVVRAAPGSTRRDVWDNHTLGPRISFATIDDLTNLAERSGVPVTVAEKSCATRLAEAAAQEEAEQEEARLQAERERDAERRAREAAEAERDAAQEEAEKAEETAEAAQQERDEAIEETTDALEQVESDLTEVQDQAEKLGTWVWIAGAAAALLALLASVVAMRRRADRAHAEQTLEAVTARFDDCLFEGQTSDGTPVALRISGKDLLQEVDGISIGRNPENSEAILTDESVGRRHARIFVENDVLLLVDLDSTNGTSVNGQKLIPHEAFELVDGDAIEFGGVRVTLRLV